MPRRAELNRRIVRVFTAGSLALAALGAPLVVAAKPADLPGSLDVAHASELFAKKPKKKPKADKKPDASVKKLAQQAAKHERKGNYEEARDAYRELLELDDAAKYRVRLAAVEARLGNLVEAAEMLREIEDSSKSGAADKQNAERERTAIEERTPKLELKLPEGFSGSVSVDGEELDSGSRKSPVPMNPGSHRVHAEAAGYLAFDENLELKEGESRKLSVELEPESDGEPVEEKEPLAEKEPASGSSSRTLGFIGIGVGVVGAGVGTFFALRSRSTRDELDSACPNDVCPPSQQAKFDEGKRDADIATVAFIVGGVGLGAGLVLLLTAPSDKEKPTSARVTPLIGPRSLGVQGRF